MAAGNGFKYVISTEVNLSPASINKLVSDIRGLDQQIQKSLSVNVNARLNNNAIKSVQQQIGNTKATLSVGLKIDRTSLISFKREIDTILANAKRDIEVSLTASNTAQQASTRQQPLDRPQTQQTSRPATQRLPGTNNGSSSRSSSRSVELAEKRLAQASLLIEKANLLAEKTKRVQLLNVAKEASINSDGTPRVAKYKATGAAERLPYNSPVMETIRANKELEKQNKEQEKQNGLFDKMFENTSRHFAFHIGIVMGFYKIQEAIVASIKNMKDFESEFLKIQNLVSQRNTDANPQGIAGANPFSEKDTQKDVFDLGKRYGRDPIKDVMPVYTDLLRRSKIVSGQQDAKDLTQLVIRTVLSSHGNQATPQEFMQTSQDMENILQQMIPYWTKQNPQAGKGGAIKKASSFVDRLSMTGSEGGRIDKTLEALSNDILPMITEGNTGLNLDFMTSFIASAQKYAEGDVGGKELATATRVLFTNLTKQTGSGSQQVNRMLGIQNKPTTSLKEKLALIHARFQEQGPDASMAGALFDGFGGFNTAQFSEGEKQNLALSSASSGGTGGSSRASEFMNLFKALDDAYKLSQKEATPGIAETNAKKSGDTLSGLLGKLNASFQDMSITLGAAGLLDVIKTIVKMTTGLVNVVNGLLQPLAWLHQGLKTLGSDFTDILSTVVTTGLAIKGASLAKGMLFGGGGNGLVGKIANTTIDAIGPGGLPLRATAAGASTVAKSANWWSKGASLGSNALNLVGLGSLAGGVKTVATGEKLASVFSTLLPILSRFGLLLTRLSIWGAVAGAVFAGYKVIGNINAKRTDEKAAKLTDTLTNSEQAREDIKSNFSKIVSIKSDKSMDRITKQDEFDKIDKHLKDTYGVESGSLYGNNSSLKMTTVGNTGDTNTGTYKFDPNGAGLLNNMIDSMNSKMSAGEALQDKRNHQLVDQFKLMSDIKALSDTIDNRQTYNQIANSLNDMRFTGSKDSTSYLTNGMKISENTIGGLGKDYTKVADQRGSLALQSIQNELAVNQSTNDLAKIDPKLVDEVKSSFQSFKGNNQLGEFLTKYKTDKTTDPNLMGKYNLAQDMFNQNADLENTQKLEETHQKVINTITTEINKYQDLHTQYLLAASGVNVLDASLKAMNAELSDAKTAFTLAIGDDAKFGTASGQFGVMAKQTRLYSAELLGVKHTIESIKASNPHEDFSIGTLNNPNGKGLSANQQGVKQLLDKQNEISQSYNSSVEALKQQSDTMVDLVMNTSKYKSIWDSVQSRIELSKQLYGQIRDIEIGSGVSRNMGDFNQRLQGSAFDSGGSAQQGAVQRRDAYASAYEQTQKAIATYGDDANKLKEALAKIDGNLGTQLKIAFIDPLKELVSTNFQEASKTQLQASNVFAQSIDTLQKILDADAARAGIPVNNGSYGVYSGGSAPTTSPNTGLPVSIPGMGSLTNKYNGTLPTPPPVGVIIPGMVKINNKYAPQASVKPIIEDNNYAESDKQDRLNAKFNANKTAGSKSSGTVYDGYINQASAKYAVDTNLIKAVIQQESGFNQTDSKTGRTLTSSAGALGLMQLMPGTAAGLNVDPHNAEQNIMGGTKYLADLLKQYGGDTTKALIGYNAGSGNIDKVLNSKAGEWKEPKDYVNKVTGYYAQFSGGNPPPPPIQNKGNEAQLQNQQAIQQILSDSAKLQIGAITEQVNSLSTNGIKFALDKSIRDANTKSSVSGIWTDSQTGYYDSVHQARSAVMDKKYENQATLSSYKSIVGAGGYNDSAYNQSTGQFESKFIELTPQLLEVYKTQIQRLEENTNSLNMLDEKYKQMGYSDPRDNTTEANKQIGNVLESLKSQLGTSAVGDKRWYDDLQSLNNMFQNYFTLNKKVAVSQEAFDNTGFGYQNLGKLKQLKFDQDIKILFDQMQGVSTELGKFAEGTNKWHVILEDAVALQEKLVGLENKKTETAKRYFELTNRSISPYINARAYTQSRDYHMASENYSSSKSNYQSNSGKMDANEQLVNFQVITESHDKMLQQMNDYRSAVVGAFKAGVMSLQEYLLKLNDLRDMNNEIKQQAVDMTSSIQDGFHNALSGALKSGMQGSFTGQQDFVSGIKDSLASAVSTQMSNIVLKQSGLQDVMNGLIGSMVGSMTTGSANGSVNAFNGNDFGKKINDALSPYLPYIQQITESTKGIFTVLKDQLFNAPGGFKIDSYLYDGARAKGAGDIGWWQNTGKQNEAGSPITSTGSGNGNIVLPPMAHVPTGVPNFVTTPIEQIGNGGSLNSPIAKPVEMWNPVKAAIQGIIQMQQVFDGSTSVSGTKGNTMSHNEADLMRNLLKGIPGAEDIAKAIGNGLTPESMGISELQNLLSDSKLGQFDIAKNTDSANNNLMSLISGVGAVRDAVIASRVTTPTPTPTTSIPTGTGGSFTPPATYSGGGSSSPPSTPSYGTGGSFTPPSSYGGGSSSSSNSGSSSFTSPSSYGGGQKTQAQTIADMKVVSNAWSSSNSPATNKSLQDLNAKLGTSIGATYNSSEGTWYKNGTPLYHSGGIIGAMGFANPNSLRPNEISTIMKHGEIALQPKQLNSLAQGFMNGDQNINVSVDVNGAGSSGGLEDIIKVAVETAVQQFYRATRLDSLRNKGVSN